MDGPTRAEDALIGAFAGTAATVFMTVVADRLFRRLPETERYPLPPRELTEVAAARAGIRGDLGEPTMRAATLASHFGFGAAAGSLYASLFPKRQATSPLWGMGYGLAVWATSYFGWVPALGLLRSAATHPVRRNLLMIAAHLGWGFMLGRAVDGLTRAKQPISSGPLRDR